MGLTLEEGYRLFYFRAWLSSNMHGWPDRFEEAYKAATTAEGRVAVVCDRIDFFIQTQGTDIE